MPYLTKQEQHHIDQTINQIKKHYQRMVANSSIIQDKQFDILMRTLDAMLDINNNIDAITNTLSQIEQNASLLPAHGIMRASNAMSYHINAYFTPGYTHGQDGGLTDKKPLLHEFVRQFSNVLDVLLYIAPNEGVYDRTMGTGPISTLKTQEQAMRLFKNLIKESDAGCLDERIGDPIRFVQTMAITGKFAQTYDSLDLHAGLTTTSTDEETIATVLLNTKPVIGLPVTFPTAWPIQSPDGNPTRQFLYRDASATIGMLSVSDAWPTALDTIFSRADQPIKNPSANGGVFYDVMFNTADDAAFALHALRTYFHSSDSDTFKHFQTGIAKTRVRGHNNKSTFLISDEQFIHLQKIFASIPQLSSLPPVTQKCRGEHAKSFLSAQIAIIFRLFHDTTPLNPTLIAYADHSLGIRFLSPMPDYLSAFLGSNFNTRILGVNDVIIPKERLKEFMNALTITAQSQDDLYNDLFIQPGYLLAPAFMPQLPAGFPIKFGVGSDVVLALDPAENQAKHLAAIKYLNANNKSLATSVVFHKGDNEWLANTYHSPFILDGKSWSSVEQYIQATKFNLVLGDGSQPLRRTGDPFSYEERKYMNQAIQHYLSTCTPDEASKLATGKGKGPNQQMGYYNLDKLLPTLLTTFSQHSGQQIPAQLTTHLASYCQTLKQHSTTSWIGLNDFSDRTANVSKAKKYALLLRAQEAKYSQNPHLAHSLLATGDATLVEASLTDLTYGLGYGLSQNTPPIAFFANVQTRYAGQDRDGYPHANLQGITTQEVRRKLVSGELQIVSQAPHAQALAVPSAPLVNSAPSVPTVSLVRKGNNTAGDLYYYDANSNISLVMRADGGHHFSQNKQSIPAPSPQYEQAALAAYRRLVTPVAPPLVNAPSVRPPSRVALTENGSNAQGDKFYLDAASQITLAIRGNGTGHYFTQNGQLIASPAHARDVIKAYQDLVTVAQLMETYRSPTANGGWFAKCLIFGFFRTSTKDEVIANLRARKGNNGASKHTLDHHLLDEPTVDPTTLRV